MRIQTNGASHARGCLKVVIIGALLLAAGVAGRGEETLSAGAAWGQATNQIWAGVEWHTWSSPQTTTQEVYILIETELTNGAFNYFLPPNCKLAQAELVDSNGIIVVPKEGKRLDDTLVQTIPSKDLPRTALRPRGAPWGLLKNQLHLAPSTSRIFWRINMQDVYPIAKEGDYTFTFVVGLYRYTDDEQSVVRTDLKPVKAKIHLIASPAEARDPSKGHAVKTGASCRIWTASPIQTRGEYGFSL